MYIDYTSIEYKELNSMYMHEYEITVECHPDKLCKVLENFRKIAHLKNYNLNKNMIFTEILTINFLFK